MQRKWKRNWRKEALRKVYAGFLAGALLLGGYSTVLAAPQGSTVAAGSATISQNGATTTINQASQKAVINWNSFNIAKGETVRFNQPGMSAIALNRVTGNNASAIYGTLSANGQVFLVNPNGVLFAKGAQVNVGGLAASTLGISDKDFLSGNYHFSGDSAKSVVNQGELSAAAKGYIALLGANVANEGVIVAKEGTAVLAAGSKVNLDFTGDGLLQLSVDKEAVAALASNKGLIQADGGLVVMSAKSADALAGTVVNNSGVIEAKSVSAKNGVIRLEGGPNGSVVNSGSLNASGLEAGQSGGTVKVLGDKVSLTEMSVINASGDAAGGTILAGGNYQGSGTEQRAKETSVAAGASLKADAVTNGSGGTVVVWGDKTTTFGGTISAKGGSQGGDGGKVETSGKEKLKVADTARVDTTAAEGKTGSWLLDPMDFTIGTGATGTNYWNNSNLQTALGSSNITITTTQNQNTANGTTYDTASGSGNGDINIIAPVNWSANKLTLSAYRNINIKSTLAATGTAELEMTSGASGSIDYGLTDAGFTGKVDFGTRSGDGFLRINGNAYSVINSLNELQAIKTNDSTVRYYLGADIEASNTSAWNGGAGFAPIGTYEASFDGSFDGGGHIISGLFCNRPKESYVGLFGYTFGATLANVGLRDVNVTGSNNAGGLVGYQVSGGITSSYAAGSVTGSGANGINVGGLVGEQYGGRIESSYAAGSVMGGGTEYVETGGLVGAQYGSGSIANCYATGSVLSSGITNIRAGGLVGWQDRGSIESSYASGSVRGSGTEHSTVGGLVGVQANGGSIANCYATGSVSGNGKVGGLLGEQQGTGSSTTNSYATGRVSGDGILGGLVGYQSDGGITNSYWDADSTGLALGVGRVSATVKEIKDSHGFPVEKCTPVYSKTAGWDEATNTYRQSAFSAGSYSWVGSSGNSADWYMIDGATRPFLRSEYSTTIANAHQLQLMAINPQGSYTLAKNIDMGELTNDSGMWRTAATADASGNYGFAPIKEYIANATFSRPFTGSFDGGGHSISGLTIARPGERDIGLFGSAKDATIGNVGLTNVNVTGLSAVGGLVGSLSGGGITNSYVTGSVSGDSLVGGLAGYQKNGSVANSYATSSVAGSAGASALGGLVGYQWDGSITNSYATGSVSGSNALRLGGLVGEVSGGSITKSYATGSVTGSGTNSNFIGGLVGYLYGDVSQSCATGNVSGYQNIGGLVGSQDVGSIANSYATGSVMASGEGNFSAGGLVGDQFAGSITNSYATGRVYGTTFVGGLVGYKYDNASITNSYWDADTTGQAKGIGAAETTPSGQYTALYSKTSSFTDPSVKNAFSGSNYSGFDFNNIWYMVDGSTRPFLRSEYSTTIANAHQLQLMAMDLQANYTLAQNIGMGELAKKSGMWRTADTADTLNNYGFVPVGTESSAFEGNFDGGGHNIIGLTINRPQTEYVGLLGYVSNAAQITNVGLKNVNVSGGSYVGALAGISGARISNSYALGNVTGLSLVGGLVGGNAGRINNTYTNSHVEGNNNVGGLVGANAGSIDNSYAVGSTAGPNTVGGLAGKNAGSIKNSYAVGAVDGGTLLGGLVGNNAGGTITSSCWDLSETGTKQAKGVGNQDNDSTGTLYSGLTAEEMKEAARFAGWDAIRDGSGNKVWYLNDGHTAPLLRSFLTPLTVSADSVIKVYDGNAAAGPANPAYAPASYAPDQVKGELAWSGNTNAGTYSLTGTLYTTSQEGYRISYDPSSKLLITPKRLTTSLTGTVEKVYDGKTAATLKSANYSALAGIVGSDDVALNIASSGSYDTRNVGEGKAVTVSGLSLTGNAAGNYALDSTMLSGNVGKITPATLTLIAATDSKSYDGNTSSAATPTYTGLKEGDTLSLLGQAYLDKNVLGEGCSTLKVSGYSLTSTSLDNYTVVYQTASGTISPISLTLTANDAHKNYDKRPYSGGNGFAASGFITGEGLGDLAGTLVYGGDSQGAVEEGKYGISVSGLTSANYAITFRSGTLTIEKAAMADSAYIGAVQNSQQSSTVPPQMKIGAAPEALQGMAQTASLRYADGSVGRTLTVSGADVTIGGGLVQVNMGAPNSDVAVYTPEGQRAVYRFDAAHSVLSLREGGSTAGAAPAPVAGSGESASFELLDAAGHTARFVLEYYGSGATVTAQNEAARGMMDQPQLLTAAALAAGQDKLGLEADAMKELLLR